MRRREDIPFPDTEAAWVTLSADAIVGLAAIGDRDLTLQDAADRARRAENEAAASKLNKKPTRSPR